MPLGKGPANDLGLKTVNLSDGSYATMQIYPVYEMPESREQGDAIGNFYVSTKTCIQLSKVAITTWWIDYTN